MVIKWPRGPGGNVIYPECNYYSRLGERTLFCDCNEHFQVQDDESCSTVWKYFCNSNFIAGFGSRLSINSNWVESFNKSIFVDIYGNDLQYPELPVICQMEYNSITKMKGYLITTDPDKLFKEDHTSKALSLATIWLGLFILGFLVLFLVRHCSRDARLEFRKRFEKYENNGKDIDVFMVGSKKDIQIMKQIESDLKNNGYNVIRSTGMTHTV